MKRFVHSLRNAWRGIVVGFITEKHVRIHALFTVLVILLGVFFGIHAFEWAMLALSIGLVWTAELMNTAIERIGNRITEKSDFLIRDAKDIAAGAVLFAVFSAIAVGLIIFVPKALEKFGLW